MILLLSLVPSFLLFLYFFDKNHTFLSSLLHSSISLPNYTSFLHFVSSFCLINEYDYLQQFSSYLLHSIIILYHSLYYLNGTMHLQRHSPSHLSSPPSLHSL